MVPSAQPSGFLLRVLQITTPQNTIWRQLGVYQYLAFICRRLGAYDCNRIDYNPTYICFLLIWLHGRRWLVVGRNGFTCRPTGGETSVGGAEGVKGDNGRRYSPLPFQLYIYLCAYGYEWVSACRRVWPASPSWFSNFFARTLALGRFTLLYGVPLSTRRPPLLVAHIFFWPVLS